MDTDPIPHPPQTEEIRERLVNSVVFKGIEGKRNGFICFEDNKEEFLKQKGWKIACQALDNSPYTTFNSSGEHFGLTGIDEKSLWQTINSIPNKEREMIRSAFLGSTHKNGEKDYMAIFGENTIAYSWAPSNRSMGERRGGINILVIKFSNRQIIKEFEDLAKNNPSLVYKTLISSLYPHALTPISDTEITNILDEKGPEIVKQTSKKDPERAKEYEQKLQHPEQLIQNVKPLTALERLAQCKKVEVLTIPI